MRNNSVINYISFFRYINSNRDKLFQEFKSYNELHSLLDEENMKTFFQPILSLEEGCTVGFEILNRPKSTNVFSTTEKFYDFVGKSHNVFHIEQFFRNLSLKRYSEQAKKIHFQRNDLVFINIQPQVLADPTYESGKTLRLIEKYNLSPDKIIFELTEKESVADYKQFEKIIGHYRKQGFRIAVDDAGTGYNSLKTLLYLKPEFIKIDKSLIQNISENPTQLYLVELLLDYAIQSDTKVIAEGIETLADLRLLQNLGVHMGQGYALGKPMQEINNGTLPC